MPALTILELIRGRIEAPLDVYDRAYTGRTDPADPWTRVGMHAYELDEPLAWKAEPERSPVLSSFDPDVPGREPVWDPASSNQYALVDYLAETAMRLRPGTDWTGYPSTVEARAKARRLRDGAARMTMTADSIEANAVLAQRRGYGRVSRRGK